MIQCPRCGSDVAEGDQFCRDCGAEIRRQCPQCGAPVPPGARFCPQCGRALDRQLVPDRAPPERMTERRLVTALFADLVGFTRKAERQDPEEVADFQRSYFERTGEVIHRFGGLVEKYAGDAVMAVWGAHHAHEDDAERAVRAGIELQSVIGKLTAERGDADIGLRVGIHTGEAAVTSGGDGTAAMVSGDLMNTASRLQETAEPGTVLVSAATFRASRNAIAFEAAGAPPLAGKRQPIETWRALHIVAERGGRARSAGRDPPFVGRRAELQLLTDLLAGVAHDRRARMVTVIGEVGIGKTRLAGELYKHADGWAEPVFWNEGRARSYDREGVAFLALSDMLRRRFGVSEHDDEETVLAALNGSLGRIIDDASERAHVRQWLGALLCCGPPQEGGRFEFDAAIRAYFARMAERGPTVLVFDDLQWADTALLELIESLPDWLPDTPLLVLTLTRPELLERRPDWSSGGRGVVSIRLGPLTDQEMDQLLEGLVSDLDPRLRTHVIERAAGVPLYAVELVRALTGQGLIASVDGKDVAIGDLSDLALPETLQSLIGARIDRLDPGERSVLQDAAILGGVFTVAGLVAIGGVNRPELENRLEALVHRELIEPVRSSGPPAQFRFVQELVREVTRSRISREVRRVKHLAAANFLASLGGPDDAVLAADHYLCALEFTPPGDNARDLRRQAADVLVTAFERAATLHAHEEVLSLGSTIGELDLDLAADRLVTIESTMARAASALTRADDAVAHAERAMALSRRVGDRAGVWRAAGLAAFVALDNFKVGRAIESIEEQLEGVDDLVADPELVRLAGLLARARQMDGDHDAALAAADRALIAAESLRLTPVIADALVTKGTILAFRGRLTESTLLLESALALAQRENLPDVAQRALINLAAILLDDDATDGYTATGIELGRRVGDLGGTLAASVMRADFLMSRGEWEEAEQLLTDPLWRSATGPLRMIYLLVVATFEAFRGDPVRARVALREGLDLFDAKTDAPQATGVAETSAQVRLMTGEADVALRWAMEVIERGDLAAGAWPTMPVLLLAGNRDQVALLAASTLERPGVDRASTDFAQAVTSVRPEDPPSLAAAESLIDDAASQGRVRTALIWTLGLARWLPEGDNDRTRLMARARAVIAERRFGGLRQFLDQGA